MKQLLVLHGPNLNLLGVREPAVYGRTTLAEIDDRLARAARRLGVGLETVQSNHEGVLIDRIQAARGTRDGIVLNPGGLTHTSVALRDAVAGVGLPVVEVHLSNTFAREPFRAQDLIAPVAAGVIVGLGPAGYELALEALVRILREGEDHGERSGEGTHEGR